MYIRTEVHRHIFYSLQYLMKRIFVSSQYIAPFLSTGRQVVGRLDNLYRLRLQGLELWVVRSNPAGKQG
jgi:hypothetical protein